MLSLVPSAPPRDFPFPNLHPPTYGHATKLFRRFVLSTPPPAGRGIMDSPPSRHCDPLPGAPYAVRALALSAHLREYIAVACSHLASSWYFGPWAGEPPRSNSLFAGVAPEQSPSRPSSADGSVSGRSRGDKEMLSLVPSAFQVAASQRIHICGLFPPGILVVFLAVGWRAHALE